jgi:hypothetical protein
MQFSPRGSVRHVPTRRARLSVDQVGNTCLKRSKICPVQNLFVFFKKKLNTGGLPFIKIDECKNKIQNYKVAQAKARNWNNEHSVQDLFEVVRYQFFTFNRL